LWQSKLGKFTHLYLPRRVKELEGFLVAVAIGIYRYYLQLVIINVVSRNGPAGQFPLSFIVHTRLGPTGINDLQARIS
jgi:hypothetical protein